jgi:hypothetical protein
VIVELSIATSPSNSVGLDSGSELSNKQTNPIRSCCAPLDVNSVSISAY